MTGMQIMNRRRYKKLLRKFIKGRLSCYIVHGKDKPWLTPMHNYYNILNKNFRCKYSIIYNNYRLVNIKTLQIIYKI